ncbi:MAG: hypothetical protein AAGF04_04415 [Chlamydiota bacterium]
MRRYLGLIFSFFLTSCGVSSYSAFYGHSGRAAYNESLQRTNNEQMLLNLVRLRYLDTPFFLNVSNITTQFTYRSSGNAEIPIPGFTSENPGVLGGELFWQNQPTIQYTPLEGNAFASQLLSPIELSNLQHLILSGWDLSLVFRIAVQSFDSFFNAPEASSPIPHYMPKYERFFEVTDLLRYFQRRSELQIGVNMSQCVSDKGDAEPVFDSLELRFPIQGEESRRLAGLLSSAEKRGDTYRFRLQLGFNGKEKVGIMPRSILSCMYYLSGGVEVPEEDILAGFVPVTRDPEGDLFDWQTIMGSLLHVRYSCCKPSCAYAAIRYKNRWFYIAEEDLASKRTFVLLLQLYNLQSRAVKTKAPVLTLPIGG